MNITGLMLAILCSNVALFGTQTAFEKTTIDYDSHIPMRVVWNLHELNIDLSKCTAAKKEISTELTAKVMPYLDKDETITSTVDFTQFRQGLLLIGTSKNIVILFDTTNESIKPLLTFGYRHFVDHTGKSHCSGAELHLKQNALQLGRFWIDPNGTQLVTEFLYCVSTGRKNFTIPMYSLWNLQGIPQRIDLGDGSSGIYPV